MQNAWYSFLNLARYVELDAEGNVEELNPVVDTLPGSDMLSLNGEYIKPDIVKNAFYFNNDSQSTSCYLNKTGLSDSTMTFFITIKDFSRFGGTTLSNNIMGFKGTGLTEQLTISISNQSGKTCVSVVMVVSQN